MIRSSLAKTAIGITVVVAALGVFTYVERDRVLPRLFAPTPSAVNEGVHSPAPGSGQANSNAPVNGSTNEPAPPEDEPITSVVEDLDTPWEVAFLPDGDMLVTERAGRLRRAGSHDASIAVPEAKERGEGGQMGLALHPDFARNGLLYLSFTTEKFGKAVNQVVRYRFADDALTDKKVVIDDIPAASNHDGGRIAFGPDGMLYATSGDAGMPAHSQNTASLAGKILRVQDDGAIPADNPFKNAVWSYGHRNPQGITWDDKGRLWATEHGRSGAQSGLDELNLIERGKNYGWPESQGDTVLPGTTGPVLHSGANDTWAPAGIAFADGSLFFAGLRGATLYEATLDGNGGVKELRAHLRNDYGRLRAVTRGPDGFLYVSTSNKDGRGTPRVGDDRVLRIDPGFLK